MVAIKNSSKSFDEIMTFLKADMYDGLSLFEW
jgi:hypothetical protein